MGTQRDTIRCDCGRQAPVTPTRSPWEFDWMCSCARTGTVSWYHGNPAPSWDGKKRMVQAGLRFDASEVPA